VASAVLRTDGYAPIGEYAAIGDGRTLALVARDGAIEWLPLPALDGPAVFASLLDRERCGRFELAPIAEHTSERRYLDRTNVLETTFTTDDGIVAVTDALSLQDGGQLSWIELVRQVRVLRGTVAMRYAVRPRFDFGFEETRIEASGHAFVAAAGTQLMALQAWDAGEPVDSGGDIAGEFELGEERSALLVCVFVDGEPLPLPPRPEIELRLERTAEAWRRWIDFHTYRGTWPGAVTRSLLALKLLIQADTGAVAAAGTTSLPERVGGDRNYDYRYAWVRDSALTLDALGTAGYREQVHASLSWLLDSTEPTAPRLDPFYTLDRRVPEGETHLDLDGYRGSLPVRKGNSASGQLQLDCYGDLVETIELYVRHGNRLDLQASRRVVAVADHVCRVWLDEDSSIWELPELRHYTLSKIKCWVALDRSIALARGGHVPDDRVEAWTGEAQRIRGWIDANCWSERRRSYTFYAGTDDLDAAVLLAARVGYLEAQDSRLHTTIDAVRRELGAGGPLLYRYTGQSRHEGAFVACSFWLVEALARTGRLDEARRTMDELLALSNDVGLFSEEIDPASGAFLGNFPQGLSHLSLVNAAHAVAAAEEDEAAAADDDVSGRSG
jgi:GH15 family glucan-1,4-alpha-glucosidase